MLAHRKTLTVLAASLTLLASPTFGETQSCDLPNVSVSSQNPLHAELVCSAADKAAALFASCNIPALSKPVHIQVAEDLIGDCLGLYRCDENTIEVLSPTTMRDRGEPDGIFAHLTTPAFFESIVVHELSHAASDNIPCPFDSCNVGAEYVAYAMQIMSLSEISRITFEGSTEMDAEVPAKDLSRFLLFLVPELFAQKVWAHLSQRHSPCDYIAQIIAGDFIQDQEIDDLE